MAETEVMITSVAEQLDRVEERQQLIGEQLAAQGEMIRRIGAVLDRMEPLITMAEVMSGGGPAVSTGKMKLPPGVTF